MDKLQKEKIALRFWLQGRNYHMALDAMEFAAGFHTGTRKDGVTPEFAHQIGIANHIRNMEASLMHPEATIATIMLHDVLEDYDVTRDFLERRFGKVVADATYSVTKVYQGKKRSAEDVFQDCGSNAIGSVVKGGDRSNNQGSMVGVFSMEKQVEYLDETETFILPMLKRARKLFPAQEPVYNLLKYPLTREIALIRAIHAAAAPSETPEP